ncbi:MarR family transcriptional regulator [Aliivibrio fischeri]|uniref:polysaccharide deacetylase family protein n=1 Tax=Aliivibrio fischeri TaxID=668 RepID=UPI0012DAB1A6|nr:polysaccharide deacetylase family protein [Aliivibrio fischeri]MUK39980.1 MarR family transcriptional regulator [Aliivibrio fischeri]
MISCSLPNYCTSELKYTIKYVLGRLFEYDIGFDETTNDKVIISLGNSKQLSLSIPFFKFAHDNWLGENTLSTNCLFYKNDELIQKGSIPLPVIYGESNIELANEVIHCDIDIFGTIFFLLSRYEEGVDGAVLDEHHRFPATSSVAYKFGFLERPLVDEYIELLSALMFRLWPELQRKEQSFSKLITCDVDWPFEPNTQSLKATLRSSLGDIIKRKNISSAMYRWISFIGNRLGISYRDKPRDKLTWIMEKNEEVGNKVAFYFITECTDKKFDSAFDFDSPKIRDVFREIHSRGHEIGLHPGYHCFNNSENFKRSAKTLKRVLKEEAIEQPMLGGRMHFLRWDSKVTPKLWEDNGFDYDSTLFFADKSGFRCGTSHSFPMYDLLNRKPLKVIQRSLINMECTIISPRYENLGYTNKTIQRFEFFKNKVKEYNGEYVLLWHNTHFDNQADKDIYKKII